MMDASSLSAAPDQVSVPETSRLRLVGSYGSNKIMAGELSRLVRRARDDVRVPVPERRGPGSVAYPFDRRLADVAVRYHRTSARVLWQVMSSTATRLEPLYEDLMQAMRAPAHAWLWDGATVSVRAFGVQEFEAGERQVVGVVKNAIIDGARKQSLQVSVDAERPDVWIDVRMLEGELFVSIDLAGRPMHKRGYRKQAGPAPVREDVAAIMLMLARYDARADVLVDPMGGAGTIAIEAACMASGRGVWCSGLAPACFRLPAFVHDWPEQAPPLFADTKPRVVYGDVDPEAEQSARHNARTAGVDDQLCFTQGDFRGLTQQYLQQILQESTGSRRGLILSNPPYGHRLGDTSELRSLYRDLGRWCRGFSGFRAGFLVDNPDFESAFGLRPALRKPLYNGALPAVFYLYEL